MPQPLYEQLDELLTRIHVARRPDWRQRVLRAVEQCADSGRGASIGDVAEYLAVEHSTASRSVGALVTAGLLTKTLAADDQRRCVLVLTDSGRDALSSVTGRRREVVADVVTGWPDGDVDALVTLLDRLAVGFEHGVRV